MYRIKHASSVPIRPSLVRIGFPIQEHMVPNIAIVSENNSDPIHLNAIVLRNALLNSPKEVEQLLGLSITDTLNTTVPETQPQSTEPKKEDVKETKKVTPSKKAKEEEEWE